MRNSISVNPRQRVLVSAVGLAVASLAIPAQADTVTSGTTTVPAPGNPNTTWTVTNNATLILQSGASSNWISLSGSPPSTGRPQLIMDGATVISTAPPAASPAGTTPPPAISVRNASATISNSTISSPNNIGIEFVTQLVSGLQPSTGTITNSTVSGFQYGVAVSAGATVTITNSTLSAGTGTNSGVNGGLINFDSNVTVNGGSISGNLAGVGAISLNTGLTFASNTTLNGVAVSAASGPAILIAPARALPPYAGHTANVMVQNGTTLQGSNGFAVQARGDVTGNVTIDGANTVIGGDVGSDSTATLNLTLQNAASLTGNLTNLKSLAVNSNAVWRQAGDNTVSNVTMNGGTIDISGTALGTSTLRTLNIGTLSGSGTFQMSTNLGTHSGDLLNVTGAATGDYQVLVRNTGAQPTNFLPLTIVQTGGGGAGFGLVNGKVDIGVYTYKLQQQGNNWALVTDTGTPVDPRTGEETLDAATGDAGDPATGDLSPSTQTVLGLSSAAPSVWYGEATVLRSRMGELRMDDQRNSGVWARTFGKQFNGKPNAGTSYRQTQYGVVAGVDGVVGQTWGGSWLVGAMLGTSHSKLTFENASTGGVNSYSAGLYATWLGPTGWYFDGVFKYNRFQNSADAVMSDGVAAHGSFNNNGVGLQLEFGRHLEFGDRWFVEPYVQFSALGVSGADYGLTNGMVSNSAHSGSVQARVGAAFGKTLTLPGGGAIQPYLKIALVQEFIKSNQTTINGMVFNNDLSGTRAEFGAGVIGQLRRNAQIYVEAETAVGKRLNQPWGAQIGVRYTF